MPLKFTSKIYRRDLTLQEAKDDQQKLEILINKLNNDYNPINQTKIKEKDDALESANKLFSTRNKIINGFSKDIFPYMDGVQVEKETDEETDEESVKQQNIKNIFDSENEESTESDSSNDTIGKGLKILTPSLMLNRLPIALAQLKAGNNSKKLKKRN